MPRARVGDKTPVMVRHGWGKGKTMAAQLLHLGATRAA